MVDISKIIESGANVTLGITTESLVAFAEALIEKAQAAKQQEMEANTASECKTWLDTKEVCRMCDVCEGTLITWAKRGYLVPVKVGKKNRYLLSDVNRILSGDRGQSVSAYVRRKKASA